MVAKHGLSRDATVARGVVALLKGLQSPGAGKEVSTILAEEEVEEPEEEEEKEEEEEDAKAPSRAGEPAESAAGEGAEEAATPAADDDDAAVAEELPSDATSPAFDEEELTCSPPVEEDASGPSRPGSARSSASACSGAFEEEDSQQEDASSPSRPSSSSSALGCALEVEEASSSHTGPRRASSSVPSGALEEHVGNQDSVVVSMVVAPSLTDEVSSAAMSPVEERSDEGGSQPSRGSCRSGSDADPSAGDLASSSPHTQSEGIAPADELEEGSYSEFDESEER